MATPSHEHNTQTLGQDQASPIDRFFGSYSEYAYDSSKPMAEEYRRLSKIYGWKRGNAESDEAWAGFRLALVKEFNKSFGTDAHDLLAWQTLCTFIGVQKRYTTCDKCARALKCRNFNIVDLLDARRREDGVAQVFENQEALYQYTKRTGSYFPRDCPKAGNLLRKLTQKSHDDTTRNGITPPLPPLPDLQVGYYEAKGKREARSKKKLRLVAESAEATVTYPDIQFES